MTTVVDASVVVAALVDSGAHGVWAEALLERADLAAPHLLPVEVANILHRASVAGQISADFATLAYHDLGQLRIQYFPYAPFAERIWGLRGSVTAYDAWYVALAETLDAPLATLDMRMTRAHGPRCSFETVG